MAVKRKERAPWQWLLDDLLKRTGLKTGEGGRRKGLVCLISWPILFRLASTPPLCVTLKSLWGLGQREDF